MQTLQDYRSLKQFCNTTLDAKLGQTLILVLLLVRFPCTAVHSCAVMEELWENSSHDI